MSPNTQYYQESGDAMRVLRLFATYLIIILSVVGMGSCPTIV